MTTPTSLELARGVGVNGNHRIVYSQEEIAARVAEMGETISRHYPADGSLLVLGLLKGSFIFLADLVRAIRIPLQVDFLVASSYGTGMVSSGAVQLLYDPSTPIRERHVLLVEDIVDSGTTMKHILPLLEARRPTSLEICALLHKRICDTDARWVGFEAPQEFLVGYGLDHAEDFRHLPFIASLQSDGSAVSPSKRVPSDG